jgi:hypothetical protein
MEGSRCQGYSPDMVGTSMHVLVLPFFFGTHPSLGILEHLHQRLVCDHPKIFLTSKFLVTSLFFPTPLIKLKLGLQVGGRLVQY